MGIIGVMMWLIEVIHLDLLSPHDPPSSCV